MNSSLSSINYGPRRWEVDSGIDPKTGIVDVRREDEVINSSSWLMYFISHAACAATLPFNICCSFRAVGPAEDVIVSECGVVKKVLRTPGLKYVNPCCTTTTCVDMRTVEIEIADMKANDSHGNPLVVSAQFAYRISDSISATFTTKDLKKFIQDQGESALRAVLTQYPYDMEGKGRLFKKAFRGDREASLTNLTRND